VTGLNQTRPGRTSVRQAKNRPVFRPGGTPDRRGRPEWAKPAPSTWPAGSYRRREADW